MLIAQLNSIRDASSVERILIANSRTNVAEIDSSQYDKASLQSRLSELRATNKPFVVRNVGKSWNVVKRWGNRDELMTQAKKEADLFPNRKYTVYRPEPDGHLNQSHAAPFGCMTFQKYLATARANKLYLLGVPDKSGRGASPFEMRKGESIPPIFADDIDNDEGPNMFSRLFCGSTACRRHVFFNSAYSFTNMHYDTDWNTYLCVLGCRRWTICHPGHSPIVGASNGGASYSLLRPTKGVGGFASSRLAHFIKFVIVDLTPGDVLCVPPTWWHVVEGMTDGFSCGINWFYTFPRIEVGSKNDVGWKWMHPASEQLHLKPSMMSSMTPLEERNRHVVLDDDAIQPETVANDLAKCTDNGFVTNLVKRVKNLYGQEYPQNFQSLVNEMDKSRPDSTLARQLGQIIFNSCSADKAAATEFSLICDTALQILLYRVPFLVEPKHKRKR